MEPVDVLIFEDMIHYTMVKTTMFNGVHHPDIGILHRDGTYERYRSEEHTSELQSRGHLVCRLLLEKKKLCFLYNYNLRHCLQRNRYRKIQSNVQVNTLSVHNLC